MRDFGECPTCGEAMEKYDATHRWWGTCDECGEPLEMCNALLEVLGPYHCGWLRVACLFLPNPT